MLSGNHSTGKQRRWEQPLFWSSISRRKHSPQASLITWLTVVFCDFRIEWQRQGNTILLQTHGTGREGPYRSQHWATGPTSADKHGYCQTSERSTVLLLIRLSLYWWENDKFRHRYSRETLNTGRARCSKQVLKRNYRPCKSSANLWTLQK
jgi:hypothetical protein